MAMTYQNFASLGVNLNRQKYGPLDISNVFTSAADLKYYLTKGAYTEGVSTYWYKNANEKVVPYPYEGQVLATVIDGVVSVYALALDAEGNFTTQEIGAKIETDDKTIKLVDGKLELVGLPEVTAGKTFVPSLVNGVLTWAEPDTSTAEGQQQAIDGLTTRMVAVEETLNGKPAVGEEGSEDYTPAVVGLVEKVAVLEAVDNATQAELDAYKEVVTSAIAEALQAAKDYADANDTDTIYDDTALAEKVEANRLEIIDNARDIGDLDEHVDALDSALTVTEGKVTVLEGSVAEEASKLATLRSEFDALDYATPANVSDALNEAKSYVDTEVAALEETIASLNHFTTKIVTSTTEVTETGVLYLIKNESATGIDKYDEYILVEGEPTLIGDTSTNLEGYATEGYVDSKVSAAITSLTTNTINGIENRVGSLETSFEEYNENFEAYQSVVAQQIEAAIGSANQYTDEVDAVKLDKTTFESFQETNTSAIATAKEEAIAAAALAEEAKGYAVDATVQATYATKAALETHTSEIANELLAYAKTADVAVELAKKIETGSIAHSTDELAEGVTVNGTELAIVVDAFTKAETRKYVADTITSFTGGESAKDVLLALNNHIADYEEKVGQIDAKDASQDTDIAAAMAKAEQGVADAAKVAADLVTANNLIADNAREIGVAKSSIETVNTTLSAKITALEGKDTEFTTAITALETTVGGHTTTITEHGTALAALQNKDIELAALIQGNTNKFADYYTSTQVDAKVQEAIDAIPDVDFTPYAKTEDVNAALLLKANAADVYTKTEADLAFMTEAEVDARINTLIAAADPDNDGNVIKNIENLVEYVENNAGEIAALISTVGDHTTAIGKNTTDIAALTEALAAVVQPKASEEITVATDGTLGLGKVSTDKLEMGDDTLVLDGGSAK